VSRKVCVVITARPSYARIKSALQAIRDHPELDLQLVVGASALLERYGEAVSTIEDDGFEIAARVYMVVEGENLVTSAKSTGLGLVELATVFDNLDPDIVVTVGDRYETLATAAAAAYTNRPVAHVQGGEVSGSIDERVRHAVTKLSDLHLVATARAREFIIRMGENPEAVFLTGGPDIDLAANVAERPELDFDPFERYGGVGERFGLDDGYVVVAQHPVTTSYDAARAHVTETLHAIRDLDVPALWFWPNVDAGSDGTSKGIRTFRELERPARMHFFRHMAPEDFLRLVVGSSAVVGNSSVGIREGAFLGLPTVNVGDRQSGREHGPNVVHVDYDRDAIAGATREQMAVGRYPSDHLYGDGRAGERIAEILAAAPLGIEKRLSYVDAPSEQPSEEEAGTRRA
jgi:UDP-hydrolysing UDP-N-acetyl-D-glucosamine 2-epimerase